MRHILWMGCAAALSGCATVMLPLCPSIAKNSYEHQDASKALNKFAVDLAEKRSISITQLSWFQASFSGLWPDIRWYEENYPYVLCAFDPKLQLIYKRETYVSCMRHARNWIETAQSKEPQNLMSPDSMYYEDCVSNSSRPE
jgi:hypothetical protein